MFRSPFPKPLELLLLASAAAFLGGLVVLAAGGGFHAPAVPRAARQVALPQDAPPAPRALTAPIRAALEGREELTATPLPTGGLAGKVVAVTFFASWCPPCRQELAQLKFLHARLAPRGLVVLAINHFETFDGLSDRGRLAAFLDKLAPNYPVVAGDEGLAETFGGVERIPTLLLFDRQGRPAARMVNTAPNRSTVDLADLEQRILQLL